MLARIDKWSSVLVRVIVLGGLLAAGVAATTDTADGISQGLMEVPAGAVVAFDLDRCPDGWVIHDDAAGRFVIGTGGVPQLGRGDIGGRARVVLTINEMPAHSHQNPVLSTTGDSASYRLREGGGPATFGGEHARPTQVVGGDQPHENMPPYVALRFCTKVD